MAYTVIGIFTTQESAKDAISELEEEGFDPKDVSLVMKDENETQDLGVGAITIPGIGALRIGGPLASVLGLTGTAATTVSGATTGELPHNSVAGGLIGALMGLGLPEEYAIQYANSIKSGGILFAIPAMSEDALDIEDILYVNGAEQVRSIDIGSHTLYHGPRDEIQDEPHEELYDSDQPLYHRPAFAYAGTKGGKTKRTLKRAKNRRVR